MSARRIAIACGGTGGHLFPGLAVAEVLRERGHEVMVLVSEKQIDAVATAGREKEFRIETLPSVGLPSPLLSAKLPGFFLGLWRATRRCRAMFRDFQPAAVLGMGGFTSTPPILAARGLRRPSLVHESNAIPGKANRLNARLASAVLVGFADCARHFRRRTRVEVTGTPVRASLRAPVDHAEALRAWGFDPADAGARTILVMGGSQGARGINQAVIGSLGRFAAAGRPLRFIHQTGPNDETTVRDAYAAAGLRAQVSAFVREMQLAYAAADFAVARAGAASLTELSHFGLPAALVPYPHAAEDHQTRNAEIFARAGAAVLAPEGGTAGSLAETTLGLLSDPAKLAAMSAATRALAPADAAALVADVVERSISS